ncbi:hypothetical protein DRA46_05472 [Burkholderia gladioli]|nr:hypothetical protein [Burkholderia gladioli]
MKNPVHLEAKSAQANWLDGYQVIVSEVIRTYGDSKLAHPLAARGTGPQVGESSGT